MTVPVDETPLPEKVVIGVLALQGAFIEHIHYLQRLRPKGHTLHLIPVRSLPELQQCTALIIPGGESTVISLVAANTPGLLPALKAFVRDPQKPVWGTCAGMILMAEEDGIGGGKVIKGREAKGWGGVEGLKVWRNVYGAQLDSFEQPLYIPALSNPSRLFNAIFIRAPGVHSLDSPSSSSLLSPPSVAASPTPSSEPSAPSSPSSPPSPSHDPSPQPTLHPPPTYPTRIETLALLPPHRTAPLPPSDSPLGPPNPADLGKVMLRQGKKMITSFHPELSGDVRVHEYWVERCVLGRGE